MKTLGVLVLGIALAPPAFAQTAPRPLDADARQEHYQIGVMERVLEGAVEHGAVNLRARLQAVFPDAPAQLLILDNPRVRGFRLEGYGMFFDVEVPSLNGTLTWTLRTLDQSGPAAAQPSAPVPASTRTPILPTSRRAAGAVASGTEDRAVTAAAVKSKAAQSEATVPAPAADERLLENPNEEYRGEVIQALADAMLDYSGPLSIGADEWLTVAARGIQDRPRLGPADNDRQTIMIRARGADLSAFRAGQISRDEVLKRIERRVL